MSKSTATKATGKPASYPKPRPDFPLIAQASFQAESDWSGVGKLELAQSNILTPATPDVFQGQVVNWLRESRINRARLTAWIRHASYRTYRTSRSTADP